MTAWPTEAGAVLNMIDNFGTGAFATVMDSYDYTAALNQVLPGMCLTAEPDTCKQQHVVSSLWVGSQLLADHV